MRKRVATLSVVVASAVGLNLTLAEQNEAGVAKILQRKLEQAGLRLSLEGGEPSGVRDAGPGAEGWDLRQWAGRRQR